MAIFPVGKMQRKFPEIYRNFPRLRKTLRPSLVFQQGRRKGRRKSGRERRHPLIIMVRARVLVRAANAIAARAFGSAVAGATFATAESSVAAKVKES